MTLSSKCTKISFFFLSSQMGVDLINSESIPDYTE
jgi:hypothetical protein